MGRGRKPEEWEKRRLEILKKAYELEKRGYRYWFWYNVGAFPAELMKLVTEGYITCHHSAFHKRWAYSLTEKGKELVEKEGAIND